MREVVVVVMEMERGGWGERERGARGRGGRCAREREGVVSLLLLLLLLLLPLSSPLLSLVTTHTHNNNNNNNSKHPRRNAPNARAPPQTAGRAKRRSHPSRSGQEVYRMAASQPPPQTALGRRHGGARSRPPERGRAARAQRRESHAAARPDVIIFIIKEIKQS